MTNQNNGGAAYPQGKSETVGPISVTNITDGMSLRDYFAGQAMLGLYSSMTGKLNRSDAYIAGDAKAFYQIADAMIAARGDGQ